MKKIFLSLTFLLVSSFCCFSQSKYFADISFNMNSYEATYNDINWIDGDFSLKLSFDYEYYFNTIFCGAYAGVGGILTTRRNTSFQSLYWESFGFSLSSGLELGYVTPSKMDISIMFIPIDATVGFLSKTTKHFTVLDRSFEQESSLEYKTLTLKTGICVYIFDGYLGAYYPFYRKYFDQIENGLPFKDYITSFGKSWSVILGYKILLNKH